MDRIHGPELGHSVFVPFAVLYMQLLKLGYLRAGLWLVGAVYFMFRQDQEGRIEGGCGAVSAGEWKKRGGRPSLARRSRPGIR